MNEENNIIIFRPESDFPLAKKRKPSCACSQVSDNWMTGPSPCVYVDEATRDLECRKCGARLDAFDYIWLMATEGDVVSRELKRMREEKVLLSAQIKLLNEQIRELKTEVRKTAKAVKQI